MFEYIVIYYLKVLFYIYIYAHIGLGSFWFYVSKKRRLLLYDSRY